MSGLGPSVEDLIAAFQELTEVIRGATEAKGEETEQTEKSNRAQKKQADRISKAATGVKQGLGRFAGAAFAGAAFDAISPADAARQAALEGTPLGTAARAVTDPQAATQARVNGLLGGFAAVGADITDAELESITQTIGEQEVRRGQFERRVRRQVLSQTEQFEQGAADVPFAVAASRTASDIGAGVGAAADALGGLGGFLDQAGNTVQNWMNKLGVKVW